MLSDIAGPTPSEPEENLRNNKKYSSFRIPDLSNRHCSFQVQSIIGKYGNVLETAVESHQGIPIPSTLRPNLYIVTLHASQPDDTLYIRWHYTPPILGECTPTPDTDLIHTGRHCKHTTDTDFELLCEARQVISA